MVWSGVGPSGSSTTEMQFAAETRMLITDAVYAAPVKVTRMDCVRPHQNWSRLSFDEGAFCGC
jgi:hypothetical protein